MPKLTIITICYNDKDGLNKTIESVYNQKFSDYEYLIIDGGSDDGSADIAYSYKEKFKNKNIIYKVVSEKDSGIYNAMNKGVKLGTGNYYNFMNSGDCFHSDYTLVEVFQKINSEECDVIYGKAMYVYLNGELVNKVSEPLPLENLRSTHIFCHQSSFIKRDAMLDNLYDENLRIASDRKLFMSLYKNGYTFKYIDLVICDYLGLGISDGKCNIPALKENMIIDAELFNNGKITLNQKLSYYKTLIYIKFPGMKKVVGFFKVKNKN